MIHSAIYKEAVELATYLCKQYILAEKNIIGHYEGYQKKIASNHGDPRYWFSKHQWTRSEQMLRKN